MSFKIYQISIATILVSLLFFGGCEVGNRDYQYIVRHSAKHNDTILLTYSLNGATEPQKRILAGVGDTLHIYERIDVAGNNIWNIETSAVMFAIPKMVAANNDSSRITEELSQRALWPAQPENRNGTGVYELRITDDLFVLEKQWHTYHIQNKTEDDTLFVISALLREPRRRLDTVLIGETKDIFGAEIFAYDDVLQETEPNKYNEKKLSGIVSLSITYKGISKNIDLKKPHLYEWNIERTKSTLSVNKSVFN